jgi:hypothetical protein
MVSSFGVGMGTAGIGMMQGFGVLLLDWSSLFSGLPCAMVSLPRRSEDWSHYHRSGGTAMRTRMTTFCCLVALVALVGTTQATSWELCGTLSNVSPLTCEIAGRPLTQFEYGIAYITTEPVPVVCTYWNVGVRIANKTPLFIESDNPSLGMRYGGFVFYQNTAALDDEACAGGYRQQYWRLSTDNVIEANIFSNGCYFDQPVFCRAQ